MLVDFHIFLAFLAAVLYFVSRFTRNPVFAQTGLWIFFITILSFLIRLNRQKLSKFMKVNQEVSYLPADQIRLMNHLFMLVFSVLTGAVMYELPQLPYSMITDRIGYFLKCVIGAFLSLLFHDTAYHGLGDVFHQDINYGGGNVKQSDPSVLAMLLHVLEKVMNVAAVIVLLLILILAAKHIYRHFINKNKADTVDRHVFINVEEKKERADRQKRKGRGKRLFFNDINSRIRRYYYQTVRKQIAQGSHIRKDTARSDFNDGRLLTFTPREIETYVRLPQNSRTEKLHYYYEKARYSRNGCDKEDYSGLFQTDASSASS